MAIQYRACESNGRVMSGVGTNGVAAAVATIGTDLDTAVDAALAVTEIDAEVNAETAVEAIRTAVDAAIAAVAIPSGDVVLQWNDAVVTDSNKLRNAVAALLHRIGTF